MNIVRIELLEPVESPVLGRGGGRIDRLQAPFTKLTCRPQGPGVIFEAVDSGKATIVPWANIKFVQVEIESDEKPAAKAR